MLSKNARALSLASFKSFSLDNKSKSLAPDSVISLASSLADFKFCNFVFKLKSSPVYILLDSFISVVDDVCALYSIDAIFKSSLTA